MMGGLSRGLELNTFEIAGELARTPFGAMQLSGGADLRRDSRARATPSWRRKCIKDVLARIEKIELALLSWATSRRARC